MLCYMLSYFCQKEHYDLQCWSPIFQALTIKERIVSAQCTQRQVINLIGGIVAMVTRTS